VSTVVKLGPPQFRTNYLEPFYFLSRPNQSYPDRAWAETGYYVVPDVPGSGSANGIGVGTLYRYSATNLAPVSINPLVPVSYPANSLLPGVWANSFLSALLTLRTDTSPVLATAPVSAVTHVADGVIHLRVRPFATNGYPIVSYSVGQFCYTVFETRYWTNNGVKAINAYYAEYPQPIYTATNYPSPICPDGYSACWFMSNALPACVEIELGILESQTYKSYKALVAGNPGAGAAFLSNHVGQVHIFRQRVPIHNVDPSAY
jgi:hypothetical protein